MAAATSTQIADIQSPSERLAESTTPFVRWLKGSDAPIRIAAPTVAMAILVS